MPVQPRPEPTGARGEIEKRIMKAFGRRASQVRTGAIDPPSDEHIIELAAKWCEYWGLPVPESVHIMTIWQSMISRKVFVRNTSDELPF